jgi:hypothetical protein
VNHGTEDFLFRRADVDFNAFLAQAMVGVPGVQGFRGISGNKQHSRHGETSQ